VRACMLMAELEEEDGGNMGLVREWLARASRAERDKAWVADGKVSEIWAPMSPVTGRLGGFVWTTPPQAPGSLLIDEIKAPMLVEAAPAPKPVEAVEIMTAPAKAVSVAEPMTPVPDDPGPEAEPPAKKRGWFG
jgi:HemY protein